MNSIVTTGSGTPIRVAAYCRVSTNFGEQMGSFDNQVNIYTDKISKNPNWVLADIYADPAVSGTTDNRPEFQRMLKDAEKRRFDLLLVKSISRFARNTLVSVDTVRHLQTLGIGVIFEKENIDTTKPYSEMMLTILSAFAQEESRGISERVKKGKRMKEARGEIPWNPLYGYTKADGVPFVVVEHEAEVVRRVFRECAIGRLPCEIRKDLNFEGIPGPSGGLWAKNSIDNLLRNERYTGDVMTMKVYCSDHLTHKYKRNQGEIERYTIRDHHSAIISREVFQMVQKIRKLRKENVYPYGERLICPNCGRPLEKLSSGWGCGCEDFYIPLRKLSNALCKAYAELDFLNVSDSKTREIKKLYPTMNKVEFWWLHELVDGISFGCDGRKLTVFWKCGEKTEVSTEYNRMWGDISCRKTVKERKESEERLLNDQTKKSIRKIQRKTAVETMVHT